MGTEICTAKDTESTRRRSARRCSTKGLAAARALKSSAPMTHGGATLVALPSPLPPPISALRITLFLTTMVDGATLLVPTSISPCLCSLKSPSIVPESFRSLTAGNALPSKIYYVQLSMHELQVTFFV